MNNNSRFQELTKDDGTKVIIDSLCNYHITKQQDGAYYAYNSDGNLVYCAYPDDNITVFYTNRGNFVSTNIKDISQITTNMEIKEQDGTIVTINDGRVVEKIQPDKIVITTSYNQDGSFCDNYSNGEKVFYDKYNKISRHEKPNGTYADYFYDDNGALFSKKLSSGDIIYYDENEKEYKTSYANGNISYKTADGKELVLYKKKINNNLVFELISNEKTITGTYEINQDGSITLTDNDNNVSYYNNKGKIEKKVTNNGIIYTYDYENNRQIRNSNGTRTYSRLNHVEYDEEAYNTILNTLNEIDGSVISTSLSYVNDEINSMPDKCTCSVEKIKTNTAEHIKAIKSLSQMTNYSLLAYQTCDNELKSGLEMLVDSLFDEGEKSLADTFKKAINGSIEETNGILELKKDTNYNQISSEIDEMLEISSFIVDFNPNQYGISREELFNDLNYIKDNRGKGEMELVIHALENNCPDNYRDYNFNPGSLNEGNGHYDFNSNKIKNYQTNSEFIEINGYTFEFTQVLPSDCTKTEQLAYDFAKANVINTMNSFPEPYINAASQKNNVVVLTCSMDSQNCDYVGGGYYVSGNFLNPADGTVVIDAHSSFYSNEYTTVDSIIHEFGHKYDDILNGLGKFDGILGTNMTDGNQEWYKMYYQYDLVLPDIVKGGYTTEEFKNSSKPVSDFFAESMVAYFKEPAALKKLCPNVYDSITKIMGADYGVGDNNGGNDV